MDISTKGIRLIQKLKIDNKELERKNTDKVEEKNENSSGKKQVTGSLDLSKRSKEISKLKELNQPEQKERIAELKKSIESGEYDLDIDKLANALLDEILEDER